MYILLFIIFFNSLFYENFLAKSNKNYSREISTAKHKNFLNEIEDYKEFELAINSNDFCFFYLYNGEVVNKENQGLFKIKEKDTQIIEEVSATNPYFKKKRIHFFTLDYSKIALEKFKKYYKPESNAEVLCFYKGEVSLKEKLDIDSIKSTSSVINLINEGFNLKEKFSKKRKKRRYNEETRIIRRDLDPSSEPCYSCPTFGFNFGVGAPYWNWPGYNYGFGGPWWGSPYYRRPYGGYFGIGFGASFSRGGGYRGGHRRGR